MPLVKRLLLDVLKPHAPNALEFALAIAEQGEDYRVKVTIAAVDERTETVIVVVEGDDVRFDAINATIKRLGASLHSIDEVDVIGAAATVTAATNTNTKDGY